MSIARNTALVVFILCSFSLGIIAQPVYSLEECKLLTQYNIAFEEGNYQKALTKVHALAYSNSLLKEDRQTWMKGFYCYKELEMVDSAKYYLFKALNMGIHSLYPYRDDADYLLLFDSITNEQIKHLFAKNNKVNVINHKLIAKLRKLNLYDQVARGNVFYKDSISGYQWDSLRNCMLEVDSLNLIEVKRIVLMNGWPGYKMLGEGGDNYLWTLVQHADYDVTFQQYALKQMEAAVLANNTNKRNYAMLYDRVCMNKGLPLIFGTQAKPYKKDGELFLNPLPLQDTANVDHYRLAFGLTTLASYYEYFREYFKEKDGAFIPYSNK